MTGGGDGGVAALEGDGNAALGVISAAASPSGRALDLDREESEAGASRWSGGSAWLAGRCGIAARFARCPGANGAPNHDAAKYPPTAAAAPAPTITIGTAMRAELRRCTWFVHGSSGFPGTRRRHVRGSHLLRGMARTTADRSRFNKPMTTRELRPRESLKRSEAELARANSPEWIATASAGFSSRVSMSSARWGRSLAARASARSIACRRAIG